MWSNHFLLQRRELLHASVLGTGALLVPAWFRQPGLFAEELEITPTMTEGPFFPDKLPLDTDNDLLIINDSITPAVGDVTHLSGRILGRTGEPIPGALVEIWQVDNHGSYLHSRGGNPDAADKRDSNFQGYGKFLTSSTGEYYFRTIKPVTYPGRTPHIHFRVSVAGKRIMSTQMLIKGNAANARDGLFRSIRNEKSREMLLAEFKTFKTSKHSKLEQLAAKFDLVVGYTPDDQASG